MGLCMGTNSALTADEREAQKREKARSKDLENQAREDHHQDAQVNKLLLLGAGESGKSTLFKQMITIYGTGFPESERETFTPIIYNNMISSLQTLLSQSHVYGYTDKDKIAEALAADKAGTPQESPVACKESFNFVQNLAAEAEINAQCVPHIQALWADPAIQACYENRAKFQLTDSAKYFIEAVERVAEPDYLPSEADVLRSRVRTTGIVENNFVIEGNKFRMFDVGGQRNERKKWIHCFENVTAVLFVGVLSEYDLMLYEDENMNRMEETINLFDEICNSRWFRETAIILFLNKRDLFQEKIKRVPLNVCPCFADYEGPVEEGNEYEEGLQLIQQTFDSKNKNQEKIIYWHATCATDTTNVAAVFDAVKDIIIRKSLGEAGLV